MATFKPKNFLKQNTPPLAQKIGDVCLAIGAAGTAIIGLPIVLPAAIIASIPAVVFTIGGYGMAIGVIGKAITKCFGKTEKKETQTQ